MVVIVESWLKALLIEQNNEELNYVERQSPPKCGRIIVQSLSVVVYLYLFSASVSIESNCIAKVVCRHNATSLRTVQI